jgi:hypothetical protein
MSSSIIFLSQITMWPFTMLMLLILATSTFSSSSPIGQSQARHHHGANSIGTGRCLPHERGALLAFKRGITSDPAGRLASWHKGEEDCCRWTGVWCSNKTGHVLAIQLGNDNPEFFYTRNSTALAGQISPSLLSLHHLEHLDLSLNNVSGPAGRLPEFLGLLKNLRYLNLSGTSFFGTVPPQLGNLSKLHYLDLSQLSADVPPSDNYTGLCSDDI